MRRASAALALLLTACAERRPSAPEPAAIEPATAVAGSATAAVITGRHFFLDADVDWHHGTTIGAGFRALLGTSELADLTYVDSTELRGTVPGTLSEGVYSLTVIDPAGRVGTLGSAFVVTILPPTPTPTPTPVDCFDVTTAADESDALETANPPHVGTGLSLREAIDLSNAAAGHDCIRFASALVVQPPVTALPALSDPAGTTLDGAGLATIDGSSMLLDDQSGLEVASPNNLVTGVRLVDWTRGDSTGLRIAPGGAARVTACAVENADTGIAVLGSGSTIGPATSVSLTTTGINVDAPDVTVDGCTVTDSSQIAVQVTIQGARARVLRTRTMRAAGAAIVLFDVPDVRLDHLTVHDSEYGIATIGATNTIIRNTILSQIPNSAIYLSMNDTATVIDWLVFFGVGTACDGCTTGPNVVLADPLYVDELNDDLTPGVGSPAIDSGTNTGIDLNGAGAGLFNGTAPDRGAIETP